MKENIIQAIVAKMQRNLDCRQMVQLKAVLASELHNVEIIEKKECAKQQAQENEHLLNSFISAKKIEGCSDKTLAYYRNTIERLLFYTFRGYLSYNHSRYSYLSVQLSRRAFVQ